MPNVLSKRYLIDYFMFAIQDLGMMSTRVEDSKEYSCEETWTNKSDMYLVPDYLMLCKLKLLHLKKVSHSMVLKRVMEGVRFGFIYT